MAMDSKKKERSIVSCVVAFSVDRAEKKRERSRGGEQIVVTCD
jgi:hypothetical protein